MKYFITDAISSNNDAGSHVPLVHGLFVRRFMEMEGFSSIFLITNPCKRKEQYSNSELFMLVSSFLDRNVLSIPAQQALQF